MDPADQVRLLRYLRSKTKPATRGEIITYSSPQRSRAAEIQVLLDRLVRNGYVAMTRVEFSGRGFRSGPTSVYLPTAKLLSVSPDQLRGICRQTSVR